jgi:aerobic C4-dicarboxylate transport protein
VVVFIVAVLGSICALFGINLASFLGFIRKEIVHRPRHGSSESVLQWLLEKLPLEGCSRQSVGLVLPIGYAYNLSGASIYMSMGVIFLATAYGVPLDLGQQLDILGIMLLTSKGAATVSGGCFVVFAATVAATRILPIEGLAILFGFYRCISIAIAPLT